MAIALCALSAQAAPDFSQSSKSVDKTTALPGDTLTYTIKVISTGDPETITVQDSIPAGTTYVANSTSATAPQAAAFGFPLSLDIADQNGQSALVAGWTIQFPGFPVQLPISLFGFTLNEVDLTFRVTVNQNASGQICNTSNITGGGGADAATTNPCTTVSGPQLATPELTVRVNGQASNAAPHNAHPGDTLQYSLVLTNSGAVAATGVHLHVDAPPFTQGLDVISQGDSNATLSIQPGGANNTGQFDLTNLKVPANFQLEVVWEATAFSVAQFQSAGISSAQINGKQLPEQGAQTFASATTLSDDPATGTPGDATIVVMQFGSRPDFSGFTKALTGSESRQPGDTVVYTLTIPNDGTAAATNVRVSDTIDPRLTNPSVSGVTGGGSASISGGVLSATWASIAAGASASLTLTATIATPLANGTTISNQAFATSSEITTPVPSDDPATPATADATVVTIQSAPDLSSITKTVAAAPGNPTHSTAGIHPGDTVRYTITIPNTGTAAAHQIVVTDAIDPRLTPVQPIAGGTFSSGTITFSPAQTLNPNDPPIVLTFDAVVQKPLANGTVIANQASVSAQGVSPVLSDDPNTQAPHDSTKFTVVSAADLSTSTKAVKNLTRTDGSFHAGDQLQFTITPINTGDEATSATVVSDVLDANLTFVSAAQGGSYTSGTRTVQWNLASVAPGTGSALTFIASIVKPIADSTSISNFATFAASELQSNVNSNTVTFTVHSAPDLSGITKIAQLANGQTVAAAVSPGTVLTYVIKIPNAGDANATNAVVTDAIDTTNLDQVTPLDSGTFTSGSIRWNVGGINASASATVRFTARVKTTDANGTTISNQAQVTSSEITQPQLSDDPSTNTPQDPTVVKVSSKPDLSTSTKSVTVVGQSESGLVRPGDTLSYTITVINSGSGYADNVVVTDVLDTNLVNAQGSNGVGVTGGALTWIPSVVPALAHVAPGAANAVTLTFTAQVASTATDGTIISNQGNLSCDESSGYVTDDPATATKGDATKITVHYPVLALTKTVRAETPRGDGTIHPGDFVAYTITVTDNGTFNPTGVHVVDPIDANLDTVSAGEGGVLTAASGGNPAHLDWTVATTPPLGTLVNGRAVQLVVRARVKPGTANGTVVSDQAALNLNESDHSLLSDDPSTQAAGDPTRFTVKAIADLHTSTKSVVNSTRSDGTWRPGDAVAYTITVKNSGDATADHAVVADALDPALTQVAAPTGNVTSGAVVWSATSLASLASVAPGASVSLAFTAVIAASANDQQVVANQGALSFDELSGGQPQLTDDPSTAAPNDPTKFTVTASPRLSHSVKTVTDVSSNSGVVHPGDILEYEIHVLNDGSQVATNTVLTDMPPPQTTYVAGSTTLNGQTVADLSGQSALATGLRVHSARAGTADGTVLVSTGAPLDDTVAAVSFRVRVSDSALAGTQISNQGMLRADRVPQAVTDDPTTPVLGDATTVVVGSASLLTAEKSWSLTTDANQNGAVDVGDVIQYTIEVDNHGSTAASGVSIEDDLPAGATYVAGSLALNTVAVSDSGNVVGTHVHVAIGALAPGAHAVATFRMHVDQPGTLSNQAQVVASGGISINSDGDPTLPGIQPTLTPVGAGSRVDLSSSSKAVLDENGGDVEPGDELTYTITLVNGGGVDATQALIDDTLPPGLSYVAGSATGDGTIAFQSTPGGAGIITASNVTVRAGGRAQLQFRVKVLANVALGSTIRNEAGVRVTPSDARLAMPVVVVVGQAQGTSSVAGKVAWDLNSDGLVGDGDRALPGFQVLVRRADLNNGSPIKTLITDAQGNYRASDLPPAPYFFEALSAEGTHFLDASVALAGQGGTVAALDLPVQPGGALVRADRSVVAGARMVLLYDDSEVGQTPPACEADQSAIAVGPQPLADGKSLPRAVSPGCLRTGQQAQTTGALGLYRFDIVGGSTTGTRSLDGTARHYRLMVLPETPMLSFPGSKPAPQPGFATAGPVVPLGAPNASTTPRWFQRFTLAPGDVVTNNHVQLDSSSLRLVKVATRTTAMIGDLVGYSITLQNPSSQDMLVDANGNGGVHLADVLPPDLRYAAGSARADRLVATSGATTANGIQPAATRHCPLISQDALGANCAASRLGPRLPDTGKSGQATVGANLDFGPYDLAAGETLELRYQAVVLTSAKPGDAINSAVARAGGVNVSNSDSAIVRIAQDPLFDLSSLVGKVYCEKDAPGRAGYSQDADELGVPGVRIYEDEGWFAETDATGKFHFRGLQPGLHRFKIDPRTLPPGASVFDDGSITTNLTAGLDARGNFPISCQRKLVGPDRVSVRYVPPPPPQTRTLVADPNALELRVDGTALLMARGSLRLLGEANETAHENVIEVDPAAQKPLHFEALIAGGPVPLSWRVSLTDATGTLLGEALANGAPPESIELSPTGALPIGATLRAQLELRSDAGRYLSPILPLRVIAKLPPAESVATFVLHGQLFDEQNATQTPELAKQIAKAIEAAKAKPELQVDVEVHTAYLGSLDEEHVLSDQRARAVRELLLTAGIAPERIHARGRGSDVPLEINVTEKARLKNRRIVIQLMKPQPPPAAPEAVHTDALTLYEGKALAMTVGQPIAELAHGQSAAVVLQGTDGERAEFIVPKEPLAVPASPIALRLDAPTRTLSIGNSSFALPLLGLSVEPLVEGAPSKRVLVDTGGIPRGLSFGIGAPVDDVVSWRLVVESTDTDQSSEVAGEGTPPQRIAWPESKPLVAGVVRARLSVRVRGGGEGRSPVAEFIASPPPDPVMRSTMQGATLFNGRDRKLSREGLVNAKGVAEKLLISAGEDGRLVVDVFTDDARDAQAFSEARATDLKAALIAAGVPEAQLLVRARGETLPIASNSTAAGRRANNRVLFSAMAAEKSLPEAEAMPSAARLGDAVMHADGASFVGEIKSLPTLLPIDVRLTSGASATMQLALPFPAVGAKPAPGAPALVSNAPGSSAPAMVGTQSNSSMVLGSASVAVSADAGTSAPVPFASLPATAASGGAAPIVGTQTISGTAQMKTMAIGEVAAGSAPLAAKLSADLPVAGTLVRAEALWVRGSTDPRNKLTLNGTPVKLDEQGAFAVRVPLHRGDQSIALISTDPNGESATIERQVHVNPDGFFMLLLGEGDFGQGGAALDGVGDRADFGGVFLKGRASGVVEGRWDLSQKLSGIIKDVQLSGNFDTARRDAPDAFVELYDPSRYYPVDGDSGLFGQQAASQGPVYVNIKADDSHLIIGNFKTENPSSTEQLFRFDRTLYGIDLSVQKSAAIAGAGKPGLDTKLDLFGADGDLRQHHAHGELRGTGGSIYWLKDSDIIAGSEQVRLVVRDANTGVELTSVPQARDVDYTIQASEGRVIFKQAIPSVADASFLASANYTTALGGHPIFVVVDYDYRGAAGQGGHAAGAHLQETLFGVLTAGGGVASENYSGGSVYTLAGLNIGYKPKPHTFINVEVAQSKGTDAESYSSVDGGLTFGSLTPSCLNAATDLYACNASGRALRIEAGFELGEWLHRKPAEMVGTPTVGTQSNSAVPAPLPTPSGMPGAPAIAAGDLLRANIYFDTRDQGFYSSGGAMDQGATKAGLLLRWTPDMRTQITGRVDQVASDVALGFDDTTGYTTKRVLRRFSGIQASRTLGEPDTLAGRFTLTAEIDDTYTDDSAIGTTFADQVLFGAIFRATPKLNFSLYQQGTWNADASQYPAWGDRVSTLLGATYKLTDKLYADVQETILWNGNNSTVLGLRTPLFSPQSSGYLNERFTETSGALQTTTVVGAEERVAAGTRMYGEYQLDNQSSAAAQRAVMGLQNRWEVRPGLFASAAFERAQVIAGIGAGLGGGVAGDGQNIPGAGPGATLGGITGQSPTASPSLNPIATCIPGTTTSSGTPSVAGAPGACSSASGLSYNPAGAYYPGTTTRDSGSLSIEYLASERFKLSAKGELRLDQADQRLVGTTAGVADRLHFLVSVDVTSKWGDDLGTFGRVHIAQTQAQNVVNPTGPQLTEARWVELTAGLTYRPVKSDWLAVMFKATHLVDLRPLDLTSGIGDEQTSDVLAISPTFELPFHIAIAEKLAYKHTRDVLADGPALDTSTWLWVNRLDVHLHKMVDLSGEFRVLALRGPSSGAVGVGGDGERGVLLEAAFKPSRYARIGAGWNFTSFSDDELARYDHTAGGFFIRAVGEY